MRSCRERVRRGGLFGKPLTPWILKTWHRSSGKRGQWSDAKNWLQEGLSLFLFKATLKALHSAMPLEGGVEWSLTPALTLGGNAAVSESRCVPH